MYKKTIPELNLDHASFACLLENGRNKSTFYSDIQSVIDVKVIIEKN
jgi:hypothetical protein